MENWYLITTHWLKLGIVSANFYTFHNPTTTYYPTYSNHLAAKQRGGHSNKVAAYLPALIVIYSWPLKPGANSDPSQVSWGRLPVSQIWLVARRGYLPALHSCPSIPDWVWWSHHSLSTCFLACEKGLCCNIPETRTAALNNNWKI